MSIWDVVLFFFFKRTQPTFKALTLNISINIAVLNNIPQIGKKKKKRIYIENSFK